MNSGFKFGMKVSHSGEFGVVIKPNESSKWSSEPGIIRWETAKQDDQEDWRGLFSSFINTGGEIIDENYCFQYIDEFGNLKPN
ncbi:MAG: hypothetical protein ACFHU9_00545 [Fluviicola sp.]